MPFTYDKEKWKEMLGDQKNDINDSVYNTYFISSKK